MALERVEIVGDWNGKEGALRLTADKPTIKFVGGKIGNFETRIQGRSPTDWDDVKVLTPGGNVGIGTINPNSRSAVAGDIELTGLLRSLHAACAEDFDIAEAHLIDPGTVLAEDGALRESYEPYDKRVAGAVSGAGDCKPGIILDKQGSLPNRKPIALLGKVFCKVDATYAPVEVGASPTSGHAMKAIDPLKVFGALIGKAQRPLSEGRGGRTAVTQASRMSHGRATVHPRRCAEQIFMRWPLFGMLRAGLLAPGIQSPREHTR
jgi:hypothetical protein